ncbi:deoxycytidyl transferase [Coemansia spiralis]|nr:deoxycytidyl transferase [Coemansia spiralis]
MRQPEMAQGDDGLDCTEYQLGPVDACSPDGDGVGSARCAQGDAPAGPVVPGFGDFHTYFGERKRKLAEQAQQHAVRAPVHAPIFAGVVFHINGYTQPSHYELKKLLIERGGRFLHYLSKTQVTHIIASALARSKEKELQNYRVVRPEWVVDCVRANRCLPWHNYRLGGTHSTAGPGAPLSIDELDTICALDDDCKDAPTVPVPASRPAESHSAQPPPAGLVVDRFGEGLNRSWVRRNLATEKDFIPRYYANSRLHHLSTWKAAMKDYVASLRREFHKNPQPSTSGRRVIMHADFDCFFVSASLLEHPHPPDQPVAVCHTQQQPQPDDFDPDTGAPRQTGGSSQIASCNYAARSQGVKNGMFLGPARQLCPALVTLPYCFDAYQRVSRAFYRIVAQIADETQAVSVDEALLDVSSVVEWEYHGDATALAQDIRRRVFSETRCTLSIGIGASILLARLATQKAKPDGVHMLDVDAFCSAEFCVRDLPNVGHVTEECLARSGITTTADIRAATLSQLKGVCGEKTATVLYNFSHGIDDRTLESDRLRQAFGADIGWGVRFSNQSDADGFVLRLAEEVCHAMACAQRVGSQVTLRIKKRQAGQGKPAKFLGHGICDSLSKSISLHQWTCDPSRIAAACISLLHGMAIDPLDIRAVGIQVQQLNSPDGGADIGSMFAKAKERPAYGPELASEVAYGLPSASQLDPSVVSELPESIRDELRAAYKLQGNATASRSSDSMSATKSVPEKIGATRGRVHKPALHRPKQSAGRGCLDLRRAFHRVETLDTVMPSQADRDVWRELPTGIRRELARDYLRTKPPMHPGLAKKQAGPVPAILCETKDAPRPITVQTPAPLACPEPMLLGKHRLADVKQLVSKWITSSADGPLDDDIAEFGDYIERLVRGHSLAKASSVLTYLAFCVRGKPGAWAAAATAVMRQANQACMSEYGASLHILNL